MDKYLELKNEYDVYETFVRESNPGTDLGDAPLRYYQSAILKIWGSNDLYSPDYTELLSRVSGKQLSIEQVVTAMSCCAEEGRKLKVPDFFERIVESDKRRGSGRAAKFIDKLNSLLVASAMINGDFTVEEANVLSEIINDLSKRSAEEGLPLQDLPDNWSKITDRREDSYLRNDEIVTASLERKAKQAAKSIETHKPKEDNKADSSSGGSIIPVFINVNLSSESGSSEQASNVQIAKPEEAPAVTKPKDDETETLESLLAELDGLVGLAGVKQDVHSLLNFIKVAKLREKRGMRVPTISYHLVFTGNPGTGKTTVARLVGKLYYHMGILPEGQLVETDRSALVAGYLGQTAIKTQKVIQQAMGGVLFIDEAYSLAGDTEDSYGKEAIETILKAMEDHRDELVVIVAGYTDLMHKFIESNPGLSSRFSKYFEFPDYDGEELLEIFKLFCKKNGYSINEGAQNALKQHFDTLFSLRDEHFGNARTARNIFERSINAQADRIAVLDEINDSDLEQITEKDIYTAIGGASK